MNGSTAEVIQRINTFPLRIFGEQGEKYLACPYELTQDNLEASFLSDDPRIVHFQVVSTDINPGFQRHFLYSRADQRHLITSSGYLFTGKVDVYSWKARKFPNKITKEERNEIDIIPFVELLHIRGDRKNETAGLDEATFEHMKRIEGLEVSSLTIHEAMQFYNALINHVPKY